MSSWQTILNELAEQDVNVEVSTLKLIHDAKRIFVAGAGRSGLAIKSFAMRLSQMNKLTYVVGETTTPDFDAGDLLVIASGSGQTGSMVEMAQIAFNQKGKVLLLTATPEAGLAEEVDYTVILPGKGKFTNNQVMQQPMGSLFEQSVWLYCDAIVLEYMSYYHVTEEQMKRRHANLE